MSCSCYISRSTHWVSCEGVRSKILPCGSPVGLVGKGWEFWFLHSYMALCESLRSWTEELPLVQHSGQLATPCKGLEGTSSPASISVILMVTLTAFTAQEPLGNGVSTCISDSALTGHVNTAAEMVLRSSASYSCTNSPWVASPALRPLPLNELLWKHIL